MKYRIRINNPVIGVPITWLGQYSPEQFEVVGASMYDNTPCRINKNYIAEGYKFYKEDGVTESGSGALRDKCSPKIIEKGKSDYSISPDGTMLSATYGRIFIRWKPEAMPNIDEDGVITYGTT